MFFVIYAIILVDKPRRENIKGGYYRKDWFSWQIVEKTTKEEN